MGAPTEVGVGRTVMETPKRNLVRRARRAVQKTLRELRAATLTFQRRANPQITHLQTENSTHSVSLCSENSEVGTTIIPKVLFSPDSSNTFKNNELNMPLVSNEDNFVDVPSKPNELKLWAVKNSITQVALNELLGVVGSWLPNAGFPRDARTLLQTPRDIILKDLAGGQYFYFGVRKYLVESIELGLVTFQQTLEKFKGITNLITLKIGIDGVPISKSSNLEFWPILFSIDQSRKKQVHVASLFYGKHKPRNIDEFLEDFISEMVTIQTEGIECNNVLYTIRIRCIVADAPARSLIKSIKKHNGYNACERCSQKGEWMYRRVLYRCTNEAQLYNDNTFESQLFPNHHDGCSPLQKLGIGMISQIPLDYMHLCCLGIMKKLLIAWVEGPGHFKLSVRDRKRISDRLISFRTGFPKEFSRKPRGVHEIRQWKATEFRTFMLYTGPIALKGVLDKKLYQHFLLFHTAMYIFCSDSSIIIEWFDFASILLKKFVSQVPSCYHTDFLSYNMHSVQHLPIDVKNHGSLDRYSAFEFESYLYKLKTMLRTNKHHLKQVVHRIKERDAAEIIVKNAPTSIDQLSVEKGKLYLMASGNICIIKKITDKFMYASLYSNNSEIKSYPCKSSKLSIYKLGSMEHRRKINKCDLIKKCLCLNLNEKSYVIPFCGL